MTFLHLKFLVISLGVLENSLDGLCSQRQESCSYVRSGNFSEGYYWFVQVQPPEIHKKGWVLFLVILSQIVSEC